MCATSTLYPSLPRMLSTVPMQLYCGDRPDPTGPDLESLDRRYDCVEQIGFAKHEKELAQA